MIDFSFYTEVNVNKEKLQEIELKIKKLIKADLEKFLIKKLNEEDNNELHGLLCKRCWILNNMFQETSENMDRLKALNSHLRFLSAKMYERMQSLEEKKNIICDDPNFDDDFEVEGTLRFVYNDEDSVLTLPDDDFYGSDFNYMINAICAFVESSSPGKRPIISAWTGCDNLDDDFNWHEPPLNFEEVDVCYMSHVICCHSFFSLPDFIRLNDFWCEINFIEQSITGQNGYRYKPVKDKD